MRTNPLSRSSGKFRRIRGQGMTEYIIIVALIAIAAVAAVGFFGSAVKAQFASLGAELVGEDGSESISEVADTAGDIVVTPSTLRDYTGN